MTRALPDDLLSAEVSADPHGYFHRLRAADPVHFSEHHHAWLLTSYDDVAAAFRDTRLSSARVGPAQARVPEADQAAMEPVFGNLSRWLVFTDPPDHTRLRSLVSRAFSPRAAELLRPMVRSLVDDLLDGAVEGGAGSADLRADLAVPLPAIVIAELLGVPVEDRRRFREWSDEIGTMVFRALAAPDPRAAHGMIAFDRYLRELIAERRRSPGGDLLTELVEAHDFGDRLTEDELVATCTLLLFAGHGTTVTLIANGLHVLLEHPTELARLRDDPSLLPLAVEELLRFEGPASLMVRIAKQEAEIRGRMLAAGDRVFLGIAAANRDPERFHDPDRLDVGRVDNPHLGFGVSIHYCLGAPLARMETQEALGGVLRRFPNLRHAGDVTWGNSLFGRSVRSVPVRLEG